MPKGTKSITESIAAVKEIQSKLKKVSDEIALQKEAVKNNKKPST